MWTRIQLRVQGCVSVNIDGDFDANCVYARSMELGGDVHHIRIPSTSNYFGADFSPLTSMRRFSGEFASRGDMTLLSFPRHGCQIRGRQFHVVRIDTDISH